MYGSGNLDLRSLTVLRNARIAHFVIKNFINISSFKKKKIDMNFNKIELHNCTRDMRDNKILI